MEKYLDIEKPTEDMKYVAFCRNSGRRLEDCIGDCWGFWQGKKPDEVDASN